MQGGLGKLVNSGEEVCNVIAFEANNCVRETSNFQNNVACNLVPWVAFLSAMFITGAVIV
jgi:hypothetical protein